MDRLALACSMALGFAAPATAQYAPQNPPITNQPTGSEEAAKHLPPGHKHSTTVYHGPHRYLLFEKGRRPGDPPIIDHRYDTLIVEPTHSTITIMATVPQQ